MRKRVPGRPQEWPRSLRSSTRSRLYRRASGICGVLCGPWRFSWVCGFFLASTAGCANDVISVSHSWCTIGVTTWRTIGLGTARWLHRRRAVWNFPNDIWVAGRRASRTGLYGPGYRCYPPAPGIVSRPARAQNLNTLTAEINAVDDPRDAPLGDYPLILATKRLG